MVQQFGGGIERSWPATSWCRPTSSARSTNHLAVLRNLNQPLPGTLDANGAVPYPDFGNIQAREMNGEANYKGVDLSFEKRFSDGYGYRASYTIGEARDQAPEHLNASSGRAAEHARPRIVGRARATSTSVIASSPTSSSSCRSARARRCCRTASPARFSAAGW